MYVYVYGTLYKYFVYIERSRMKKLLRFRFIALTLGSLAVLAWLGFTHPGAQSLEEHMIIVMSILAKFATPVLAVTFAFIARKALLDYIDVETLYRKAKETATGAGLVFLGICILMFGLLGLFGNQVNAQEVTTYIPQQAYLHIPTLRAEQQKYWADHPKDMCSLAWSSTNPVLG